MSYFFIANITIKNEKEYQQYINKAGDIFKKYKGEYLAVDNSPIVLEGKWNYTRLVVVKFDSKAYFEDWYNSKEYQEILQHRLKAADCDSILVRGLENKD